MPIAGTAVMRAADAMLRALGGEEIALILPVPGEASGTSYELGLSDNGVQQYPLSPVIVRDLPAPASGPAQRLELLAMRIGVAGLEVMRESVDHGLGNLCSTGSVEEGCNLAVDLARE